MLAGDGFTLAHCRRQGGLTRFCATLDAMVTVGRVRCYCLESGKCGEGKEGRDGESGYDRCARGLGMVVIDGGGQRRVSVRWEEGLRTGNALSRAESSAAQCTGHRPATIGLRVHGVRQGTAGSALADGTRAAAATDSPTWYSDVEQGPQPGHGRHAASMSKMSGPRTVCTQNSALPPAVTTTMTETTRTKVERKATAQEVIDEINPPVKKRLLIVACFPLFLLLALPWWWATTSIERLPLPKERISAVEAQHVSFLVCVHS